MNTCIKCGEIILPEKGCECAAKRASGSLQPDGSAAGVEWPEVIFQKWPPTTGAQQCCKCGGWIMGAQSYWINNTGPMCPSCYKQQNDEAQTRRTERVE